MEALIVYNARVWEVFSRIIIWRERFRKKVIRLLSTAYRADAISDGTTVHAEMTVEKTGELLDKYGDTILRVAYSYLHNMSDAEDILQDTLIQVMRTKPIFESPAHEKAWLIRVASNLSKNKINYNKLRDTDELNDELVSENREDLSFVWEAVKQLPEKFREVIHLFYQEGYSTKDIANILNRNESTVRSDLKRGRDQLRLVLKEAYDFE